MSEELKQIIELRDTFTKEVMGLELYDYQKRFSNRIIESIIFNEGSTIVSSFPRQSGKTEAVCSTITFLIVFYFKILKKLGIQAPRFFNVGIFAPQIQQSETDFLRIKEYVELLKKKGFCFDVEVANGDTIKVRNKDEPPITIYCFTLSMTSHPESKTLHVIIYEESQDLITYKIDKTAAPMGAATNATEVFIGTGGYSRCKFWEFLQQDKSLVINYSDAIKERREAFERSGLDLHLNYEKHIEKKKREISIDSDEFKTQYGNEWILKRGQFISFEELLSLEEDYNINFIDRFGTCFVGVDWGKANDSTVMTVIDQSGRIVKWLEILGDDYYSQYVQIVSIIENHFPGTTAVFCDATATQDQAVDMLRVMIDEKKLKAVVEGVKFSLQSKDQMFKNVDRLIKNHYVNGLLVQKSFLKIPKSASVEKERFFRQFMDLQKEVKGELWSCHHPEGSSFHDDYAMSLGLACLGFVNNFEKYEPRLA